MQPRPARTPSLSLVHTAPVVHPAPVHSALARHEGVSRVELARGGWVVYEPSWLDSSTASALFDRLLGEITWQQGSIRIFGKQVLEPRLIAWAGEMPYRYSGRTLAPAARPACLEAVWHLAETFAGVSFNHVLMNRYRTGDDSMGWHSDAEPELGQNPPVVSVSLGATRRFSMKPKPQLQPEPVREWRLTHGSVLWMGGSTQHHYRHSVPRQRGVPGERLNLTFRRVLCAPGGTLPAPSEARAD